MHKKAKKKKFPILMKKCTTLEKKLKEQWTNQKERKNQKKSSLRPNNLWKAVKIGKKKTQAPYPDEMVDFNGQKLKTNQEKEDAFFVKKTEKSVSNEVNNRKEKKFLCNWRKLVDQAIGWKTQRKLKPKHCFGFDRVPLVFLRTE